MALVSVSEITSDSVTFKQAVHSGGGRMSLPSVVAKFLNKDHAETLRLDIKRGAGWISKNVTLASGKEILANEDSELRRIMKPGAILTLRAHR